MSTFYDGGYNRDSSVAPYELPFCFYQILFGHNTGMLSEAVTHSSDKNLHFSYRIFFSIWI